MPYHREWFHPSYEPHEDFVSFAEFSDANGYDDTVRKAVNGLERGQSLELDDHTITNLDACTFDDLVDLWSDLVKDNIATANYNFPMEVAMGNGQLFDVMQHNTEFLRRMVQAYILAKDPDDVKEWVEEHTGDYYVGHN